MARLRQSAEFLEAVKLWEIRSSVLESELFRCLNRMCDLLVEIMCVYRWWVLCLTERVLLII